MDVDADTSCTKPVAFSYFFQRGRCDQGFIHPFSLSVDFALLFFKPEQVQNSASFIKKFGFFNSVFINLNKYTRVALDISRWSSIICWFSCFGGEIQRSAWMHLLPWALSSAATLNSAVALLFFIFYQHRRASLPTLWSSCWTPEPIHPSKTWRALSPRKSQNPAPSPPSCVSTRPRKAKAPPPPPLSFLPLTMSHSVHAQQGCKGFLWLYFQIPEVSSVLLAAHSGSVRCKHYPSRLLRHTKLTACLLIHHKYGMITLIPR